MHCTLAIQHPPFSNKKPSIDDYFQHVPEDLHYPQPQALILPVDQTIITTVNFLDFHCLHTFCTKTYQFRNLQHATQHKEAQCCTITIFPTPNSDTNYSSHYPITVLFTPTSPSNTKGQQICFDIIC